MTTIEEQKGSMHIHYRFPGTEAEYTAHLKAIAAASTAPGLDDETRQTLGGMLVKMLPSESQVQMQETK